MLHFFCRVGSRLGAFLLVIAAASALAVSGQDQAAELQSAWQAAEQTAQIGPATVKLRDQATLALPAHSAFIPLPAANKLMVAMGNGADPNMIGLIVPTQEGEGDWMVVASYEKSGYIRDDDAVDWKADELFDSLKAGTAAQNKERAQRGLPELELTGWIERPHYDAATHQLVWSIGARDKHQPADAQEPQTVNYNTYALGREGYISLNLLTNSQAVERNKPAVRALLDNLSFNSGKRYADFNSNTDHVAAYGLTALVAGVAAKKLGLIGILAAFFVKFAKIILPVVLAVLYAVGKFFTRKDKSAPSVARVNPPDPSKGPPDNPPPQA
jgi:uncharacterized membrane-anchored protein